MGRKGSQPRIPTRCEGFLIGFLRFNEDSGTVRLYQSGMATTEKEGRQVAPSHRREKAVRYALRILLGQQDKFASTKFE